MRAVSIMVVFVLLALFGIMKLIAHARKGGRRNWASMLAGLAAIGLPLVATALNTHATDQSYEGLGTLLLLAPLGWLMSLVGMWLGVTALSRSEPVRSLSIAALVLNTVIVLGPPLVLLLQ